MFIKFRLPLIFVQGGRKLNGADQQYKGAKIKWAKIKWSENLNEAKFEKSKVDNRSFMAMRKNFPV